MISRQRIIILLRSMPRWWRPLRILLLLWNVTTTTPHTTTSGSGLVFSPTRFRSGRCWRPLDGTLQMTITAKIHIHHIWNPSCRRCTCWRTCCNCHGRRDISTCCHSSCWRRTNNRGWMHMLWRHARRPYPPRLLPHHHWPIALSPSRNFNCFATIGSVVLCGKNLSST